jgi:hypothetical protein
MHIYVITFLHLLYKLITKSFFKNITIEGNLLFPEAVISLDKTQVLHKFCCLAKKYSHLE